MVLWCFVGVFMVEVNDLLWIVWECLEGWCLYCVVCDVLVVDFGISGLLYSKKGNFFVYYFVSEFEDWSVVEYLCDDWWMCDY